MENTPEVKPEGKDMNELLLISDALREFFGYPSMSMVSMTRTQAVEKMMKHLNNNHHKYGVMAGDQIQPSYWVIGNDKIRQLFKMGCILQAHELMAYLEPHLTKPVKETKEAKEVNKVKEDKMLHLSDKLRESMGCSTHQMSPDDLIHCMLNRNMLQLFINEGQITYWPTLKTQTFFNMDVNQKIELTKDELVAYVEAHLAEEKETKTKTKTEPKEVDKDDVPMEISRHLATYLSLPYGTQLSRNQVVDLVTEQLNWTVMPYNQQLTRDSSRHIPVTGKLTLLIDGRDSFGPYSSLMDYIGHHLRSTDHANSGVFGANAETQVREQLQQFETSRDAVADTDVKSMISTELAAFLGSTSALMSRREAYDKMIAILNNGSYAGHYICGFKHMYRLWPNELGNRIKQLFRMETDLFSKEDVSMYLEPHFLSKQKKKEKEEEDEKEEDEEEEEEKQKQEEEALITISRELASVLQLNPETPLTKRNVCKQLWEWIQYHSYRTATYGGYTLLVPTRQMRQLFQLKENELMGKGRLYRYLALHLVQPTKAVLEKEEDQDIDKEEEDNHQPEQEDKNVHSLEAEIKALKEEQNQDRVLMRELAASMTELSAGMAAYVKVHQPDKDKEKVTATTEQCYPHGPATIWRNQAGQVHREELDQDGNDLPAVQWVNGCARWLRHGKLHRDAVDKDGCTLPAFIDVDRQEWWQQGQRCRENDKPTVEWTSGERWWYHNNDKFHRSGDKPAVIKANGEQEWWTNGVLIKRLAFAFTFTPVLPQSNS